MVETHFANPIRKSAQVQMTEAQREEALVGSYDSIFATAYRFAPYNPDALLTARGYQILKEMLTSSAVQAPLNIVLTAVLAKDVKVDPCVQDEASEDYVEAKQISDALDYDLKDIRLPKTDRVQDFKATARDLSTGIYYGFKLIDIGWRLHEDGPNKGKWGFKGFYAKPCRQIGFDLDLDTLDINSVTSYTPVSGYQFDIPLERCLLYTFQGEDNLPYGIGIGRAVYKHWWSIDNLYRFWNICLEIFGTPFILAKAPPGKATALAKAALAKIRQGAVAVLPNNVEAELMQVATGGESGFQQAVEHHIRQIAYAFEHSILSSGEGQHGSTSAGADAHQDTSDYQHCFVRTGIEQVFNQQLVRRWMRYNYGPNKMRLAPKISLGEWDAVDMQGLANAFKTYIDAGVLHPTEPQIRQKGKLAPITPDAKKAMEQDKTDQRAIQERQLTAKENKFAGSRKRKSNP